MSKDVPPYGPERGSSPLIRNCRFAVRCNQQWDNLPVTQHPRFRFCNDCQRRVVLCERNHELRQALLQNDCVAIPVALLRAEPDHVDRGQYFVGEIERPNDGQ